MHYERDEPLFLIVYGETANLVADEPEITIVDRVDRVVLVETNQRNARAARELLRSSDVTIHGYTSERDARRVFRLFRR